jgi:hypothetical protein
MEILEIQSTIYRDKYGKLLPYIGFGRFGNYEMKIPHTVDVDVEGSKPFSHPDVY